jgi:hypothetical protein
MVAQFSWALAGLISAFCENAPIDFKGFFGK